MALRALEGAAGCGKTFRLIQLLSERINDTPMAEGQRVLALTFMHGARKRLVERLAEVAGLGGRVECLTLDGFAWRLVRRWRGLAAAIGLPELDESEFDAVCDAAGALLEVHDVRTWVGRSFPVVLVDEGQDLHPQRLRMLMAMSSVTHLLVAADEFQCLDPQLRPNPLVTWIQAQAEPDVLTQVRRTNVQVLLNAANAIRGGQGPVDAGQAFRIIAAASVPFAATIVSNAIGWHPGTQDVAIITPSRTGNFTQQVAERVSTTASNQGNGPYPILWEGTDQGETQTILADLNLEANASGANALAALNLLPRVGPVRSSITWVHRQIHAIGRNEFSRAEIEAVIARFVTLRRQHGRGGAHRFSAMTVHQAKNREFDGVVVIWPYVVAGDADQKRRLLYNAVTRAKRWCTVVVQGANVPNAAPFA